MQEKIGMVNNITLEIRLSTIKHFLDHVLQETGKEIEQVVRQYEEGDFAGLDDYDNALFYPSERQEIAIRTVFYEITALVEHELQNSAQQPWLLSDNYKKELKKLQKSVELSDSKIISLGIVSNRSFRDIPPLIEKHYDIKIDELPGAKLLWDIRDIVNSSKHRLGHKDFRKHKSLRVPDYHKFEVETAYDGVEQARIFIKALWKATNR